jgi:spermidine/putrescine-binding protein
MAYEIILQAYGWEKGWKVLTAMCGNTRIFSRAASEVPKDAAAGEIACGMCIDVYAWRQIAEVGADRMGFVLPDGLTVINPDGIAVLKGAPHPELAAAFVEFVLSEPGQKLLCLKRGTPGGPREFQLDRLPLIPGLAARLGKNASVVYDPYSWTGAFTYDSEKGALRWTILNDLLGAVMIDTHGELAQAWKAALSEPAGGRVEALTAPPMSEQEVLDLARQRWDDPEFRAQTRARWANEAKARYRQISGGT